MYQRAQLKEQVKQAMGGARPRPMWIALLFSVIVTAGTWLINTVINAVSGISVLNGTMNSLLGAGYELEEAFEQMLWAYGPQLAAVVSTVISCSVITSLLTTLWSGLMSIGFEGYCLSMTRNQQPTVNKLFCGFPMIGKVLLTRLLVWVFTLLWSLLYGLGFAVICVIGALLMAAVPALGVILMVLAWIALMVLLIRLSLRYAMADYVLLDQGKYGLEAVTASKIMMKGNKGKLFVLYLSFIGWYLVQFAIVLVGSVVMVLFCLPAIMSFAGGGFSYGAIAGAMGGVTVVLLLMGVGSLLFASWLQPYITGSVAKFYDFLRGPGQPELNSGWPPIYGGDSTDSSGGQ